MSDQTKGWHWSEITLNKPEERVPVPIVSDASVATTGVADGRLIPVIILDTTRRPDIDDAIQAHASLGPGDVRNYWARPSRWHKKAVTLILDLQQPAKCIIAIQFDVAYKGALVDAIIRAQGVYLQAGRPGDRLRDKLESPRILVEVPAGKFASVWDKIFEQGLVRRFRREGMSKKEARAHAVEGIARWRTITRQRMHD